MSGHFVLRLVLLLAALAAPAAAALRPDDQRTRSISGTVFDAMGGVIAGATITLHTAHGTQQTTTRSDGSFTFEHVLPGSATLTVVFDLFAARVIDVTRQDRPLRIVMDPVGITEAVTVQAPAGGERRIASGTRTETPLRDVPQAISVVSRDLIADQAMRTMADVVNYVPGVGMAQGEGHRDAPIFRGNTSTSDFYVDGLRDDTQYLRDLYNVERVEVLKGPNGMIFGRGGVGGVINRVTRQANGTSPREVSIQGGSFEQRRLTTDLGHAFTADLSARLTGMYENSGSYRAGAGLERVGINPSFEAILGPNTRLRANYEFFHDERTVDRGLPSFQGRPLDADASLFVGNVNANNSAVTVHAVSSIVEHTLANRLIVRNSTRFADYDKFYQNLVPGAINPTAMTVSLTGYNSGTQRQNVFNQTDVIWEHRTGGITHTVLSGVEVGRQVTDNRRLTGYFSTVSPTTTAVALPLSNPRTSLPVEFRAAASDANNHGVAMVAAAYAQDQMTLTSRLQAIVGVRYDSFRVDLTDHRSSTLLASRDGLLSPRFALIYKPLTTVSVYTSYTRSYQPRAGEQLASLSLTTQALEPENFRNLEAGAKWDIKPFLSLSTAVYRLDHGNVVVRDAINPTVSHLVDAERSSGLEVELSGSLSDRWTVQGGYAYQDGQITESLSATVVAGARLAQVPRHSMSLWNRFDVSRTWGAGLGIVSRSDSFVATDNTVTLPGFTRVDGALFFTITPRVRAHVNIENALDTKYYWSAHNNNNIAPGSPRAVRVTLTTQF
ncbi:MAG TPA: TonB-dependent siderophore receptor [Vicinamibacterales bacterium]|nr:TonB-dependent siderophore receptor [Vicinamibacterales bacterium]